MPKEPTYIGLSKIRKSNVVTLIEPVAEKWGIEEKGDIGFFESDEFPDYVLIRPIRQVSSIERLPIKKKKEQLP